MGGSNVSTLEYVIWHVLGYSAMPVIFLMGFIATALVSLAVLRLLTPRSSQDGTP